MVAPRGSAKPESWFFTWSLSSAARKEIGRVGRRGTGQESGDDRLLDLRQHAVRIFAGEDEDEQGVDHEDHHQYSGDHASGDSQIRTEKFRAVQREIHGRKRENTDREVLHDPVDDFKRSDLSGIEKVEHRVDRGGLPFFLIAFQHGAGREAEKNGKDDDRQEPALRESLKGVHEKFVDEPAEAAAAAAGFHLAGLGEHVFINERNIAI